MLPKEVNNGGGGGGSSRRPSASVSLAIAKVTNDSEEGGLSIEFTTKQVPNTVWL